MTLLSGGRRRRRRTMTYQLWLGAAALAGFVTAAAIIMRL